jgi:hypothetical protein
MSTTVPAEVIIQRLATRRTKGAATLLSVTNLPKEKKASHLLAFARSTEKAANVRQTVRDTLRASIVADAKKA